MEQRLVKFIFRKIEKKVPGASKQLIINEVNMNFQVKKTLVFCSANEGIK